MAEKFRAGEGDWVCGEPKCGNVNFARRTSCNRCGKDRLEGVEIKKQGTEIGKTMAEKSKGLFSADDWQCKSCGNVNWARRSHCNVCNTPKFTKAEQRTGFGGGFMERDEVVEYVKREESDDEFDEFGRKKKKFRGNLPVVNSVVPVVETPIEAKNEEVAEGKKAPLDEDEEEEDDGDGDVSKYKLDSDEEEDDDDVDVSKYQLDDDDDEDDKDKKSGDGGGRDKRSSSSSSSRSSSTSSSSSSSSSSSRSSRRRSRSRSRSSSRDQHKGNRGSHEHHSRRRSHSSDSSGSDSKGGAGNRSATKKSRRSRSRS